MLCEQTRIRGDELVRPQIVRAAPLWRHAVKRSKSRRIVASIFVLVETVVS